MRRYSGRSEMTQAAAHRLADARVLAEKERWRGAMYVGGYALECKLKAQLMSYYHCYTLEQLEERITKRTGRRPEFMTVRAHNLAYLLGFADCWHRLTQNPDMHHAFLRCNIWDYQWRYAPDVGNQEDTDAFLGAVGLLYHWIETNI